MEGGNRSGTRNFFLALAVLAGEMTGPVLCAVTVLQSGGLLSRWLEKMYLLLGGVLALGFITVYFCLGGTLEEKGFRKIKKYWPDVLKLELWLAAVLYFWKLLAEIWLRVGRGLLQNDLLYMGILAIFILAALFTAGLLLSRLLRLCGHRGNGKGFLRGLLAFGMLTCGVIALTAASLGWRWLLSLSEPSMPGMLASHVFMAYCEYGILRLLFFVMEKGRRAEEAPEDEPGIAPEKLPIKLGRRAVGLGIPLILAFGLSLVPNILSPSPSVPDRVKEVLETPLRDGYEELGEGNLEQAVASFARAGARIQAFESLTDTEAEAALESVYKEYPLDAVIGALYFSGGESQQELENGIISNTLGSEWYPVLLRYYGEQRRLSGKQESLRDELLLWCVSREQFTETDCIFAGDLEESRLAVRKLLGEYRDVLDGYGFFELLVRYNREGGSTEELAYEALEKAEKEPEDMLLQYLACLIGSGYQEDGARHYVRTVEAAGRFDGLYDDGSRTDGQIAGAKRFLGDVAGKCYDFETALAYYEASYELSGESGTALDCAKICEKLEDYENCAEMAKEVLEIEPDNTQALYLLAISALKTKDVDAALDAAGRLGDLVADKDRTVDAAEENNLYVCAQYLGMKDNSAWTDYTWGIYNSLSEEQIETAKSHELLWYYMTAINQCFMEKDYEAAAGTVDKILELREDLGMAWYLRGTIAFSAKDFKKAVSSFQKSEELGYVSPALYFSMANAYDALEDYENAWLYSRRVEELLPYQDHGNDVYGISIHNKKLLRALESRLGR